MVGRRHFEFLFRRRPVEDRIGLGTDEHPRPVIQRGLIGSKLSSDGINSIADGFFR